MPIGEFCNREVVIAGRDASAVEVAQLMRAHHVGSVVIVDIQAGARKPVGVLTDRDIVVELVAKQVAPEGVKAGDLVTGTVATISDSAGVYDTLHYMREHGFRRMPVVDAQGSLVGIVTMDDYLALLAEELNELAKLITREQSLEMKLRP